MRFTGLHAQSTPRSHNRAHTQHLRHTALIIKLHFGHHANVPQPALEQELHSPAHSRKSVPWYISYERSLWTLNFQNLHLHMPADCRRPSRLHIKSHLHRKTGTDASLGVEVSSTYVHTHIMHAEHNATSMAHYTCGHNVVHTRTHTSTRLLRKFAYKRHRLRVHACRPHTPAEQAALPLLSQARQRARVSCRLPRARARSYCLRPPPPRPPIL